MTIEIIAEKYDLSSDAVLNFLKTLSKSELDDLKYYADLGCPDLVGIPEFKIDRNSSSEKPVTWLGSVPTDFTKEEYAKLERGEDLINRMIKNKSEGKLK